MILTLTPEDYKKVLFPTTTYNVPDDPSLTKVFKGNINTCKFICCVETSHSNDLCINIDIQLVLYSHLWEVILYTNQ